MPEYPCPCCGYLVFLEPPGSFDICPICFWEDDVVQLAFPDLPGGANGCSLIEGQRNFETCGACESEMRTHVRPVQETDCRDTRWRPIHEVNDRYLKWSEPQDHELWSSFKYAPGLCLYYWLPDYWLSKSTT